jgi:hypothetical protein
MLEQQLSQPSAGRIALGGSSGRLGADHGRAVCAAMTPDGRMARFGCGLITNR